MKWAMIVLLAASGAALFAAGAGAMGVEFDPIALWGGAGLIYAAGAMAAMELLE